MLFFDDKERKWIEKDASENDGEGIIIHPILRQNLDRIKHMIKDNQDAMFIITGKERTGKSTLAKICGKYLSDNEFGINNYASGLSDAAKKIAMLPDGSVLCFDEGGLIFSKRDTNRKEVKALSKILEIVGQKRMMFIIISPYFKRINDYIAIDRSLFLLQVYKDNKTGERGQYAYYGTKSKEHLYIYLNAHVKKGRVPQPKFRAKFNFYTPKWELEYQEDIKKSSLSEALKEAIGNPLDSLEPEGKGSAAVKRLHKAILTFMQQNKGKMTHAEIGQMFGVSKYLVDSLEARYRL